MEIERSVRNQNYNGRFIQIPFTLSVLALIIIMLSLKLRGLNVIFSSFESIEFFIFREIGKLRNYCCVFLTFKA